MKKSKYDLVYVVGDLHGDMSSLILHMGIMPQEPSKLYVQVGDFGMGAIEEFSVLKQQLVETNSTLVAIRGNHDDPFFFTDTKIERNQINLLADYTYLDINDELWLFVGGATSIDRHSREMGFWFKDEVLDLSLDKIDKECNTLVMHTSPTFCHPADDPKRLWDVVMRFVPPYSPFVNDMVKDLKEEREKAEAIFEKANPKRFYYGHFHQSKKEMHGECVCTLLDIKQIVKH